MSEPGNGYFKPSDNDGNIFEQNQGNNPQHQDSAFYAPTPNTPPSTKPKSRAGLITGAVLGGIIILGGGAYAATSMMNTVGDKDISKAAPADTKIFVQADLNPSNGQKVAALSLINKIDKLADVDKDKSIKDKDVKELASDIFFDDLDYKSEVEPWMGDKVAFAGWDVDLSSLTNDTASDYDKEYDEVDPYKKKSTDDSYLEDTPSNDYMDDTSDEPSLSDENLTDEEFMKLLEKNLGQDPADDFYDDEYLDGEYDDLDKQDAPAAKADIKSIANIKSAPAAKKDAKETAKFVVVYEVKDEKKATAAAEKADKATKDSKSDTGFYVHNGYLIIASDAEALEAYKSNTAEKTLADNDTYKKDMKELGGDNIVSAWVDFGGLGLNEVAKESGLDITGDKKIEGRLVTGTTLRTGAVDVNTKMIGFEGSEVSTVETKKGLNDIKDLSADTMIAGSISELPKSLEVIYNEAKKSDNKDMKDIEEGLDSLGLKLPEDFMNIFGSETTVGVTILEDGKEGGIILAARDANSDRIKEIIKSEGSEDDIKVEQKGDVVEISLAEGDASLSKDKLGNTEKFKSSLKNLDKAQFALYLNMDSLVENTDSIKNDSDEPIGSIGLTATHDGDKNVSEINTSWVF